MKDLIKDIKYNRSVSRFNHILDNLYIGTWGDYNRYTYKHFAILEIYICTHTREIVDHIRIIIHEPNIHLFYGLSEDTIINIIDKRFNPNKLPIFIN